MSPTETTIISVASGLTGILIGHRLALGRDRGNRIRDFSSTLGGLRVKFKTLAPESLYSVYAETLPGVGGAAAKIRADVMRWRRKKFMASVDRYCSLTRNQIENPDYAKKVPLGCPPRDYERGRKILLGALDEIENVL